MISKAKADRGLRLEPLERRLCMAASVGWDGPGQGAAALTYFVGEVPSNMGLSQAQVEGALETAMDAWAEVADVTFTETELSRQHDCIDFEFGSIDGQGGTLAYAYLPDDVNPARIAGDIRFDAAESWGIGNQRATAAFDLVLVAVHEIGHALGLGHAEVSGAVMRDSVSANDEFQGLAPADVDAVLMLYAAAENQSTDDPATPDENADSDVDSDPDADEIPQPRWSGDWPSTFSPRFGFRSPRGFGGWGRAGGQHTPTATTWGDQRNTSRQNDSRDSALDTSAFPAPFGSNPFTSFGRYSPTEAADHALGSSIVWGRSLQRTRFGDS